MNHPTIAVTVGYFGLFKDYAGSSSENLLTPCRTGRELYQTLADRYNFDFAADQVMLAVNDEYVSWDYALQADDYVVFIPPVAGG